MTKPDTSAKTFCPPSAIRVWSDTRFIYAEIPASDGGVPLILKYAHSEGGLTKVLALMTKQALAFDPKGGFYAMPSPKITKPAKPVATDAQQALALEVLRKVGIL